MRAVKMTPNIIEGGYGRVSKNVMRSPGISQGAKAMYAVLCTYSGGDDDCYPSIRTLADDLGSGVATAQRYLKELAECGVIVKIAGDAKTPNKYKINHNVQVVKKSKSTKESKKECVSILDTGVAKTDTQGISRMDTGCIQNGKEVYPKWIPTKNSNTKNNYQEQNNIPPTPPGGEVKASVYPFEEFWSDYGKKIGKDKTEKKYNKLSEKDRLKIKEALPVYLASTPDLQYRKYPSTWLNGKHWNDEITFPQKNQTNGKPKSQSGIYDPFREGDTRTLNFNGEIITIEEFEFYYQSYKEAGFTREEFIKDRFGVDVTEHRSSYSGGAIG